MTHSHFSSFSPLLAVSVLIALTGCNRPEDTRQAPPEISNQRALEHAELLDEPTAEKESLEVLAEVLAPVEEAIEVDSSGSFELQVTRTARTRTTPRLARTTGRRQGPVGRCTR